MKVHCNDCGTDFEITPEHHLKYNNGGCSNCAENKIVKCSKCGKEIKVNKHSKILSEMYCDECQKENNYKYCDICGRMLNDEDICDNEFCRNHNIQQFKTLIKYFGFDEQKLGTIYVEKEFNRIRNILNNIYWNKHMSSSEICKIFNYPDCSNLTRKVFKYLEIVSKTSRYSSIENIKMNRRELSTESNYKDSYHITWDNKEVYLRSSYEKDYANFLD